MYLGSEYISFHQTKREGLAKARTCQSKAGLGRTPRPAAPAVHYRGLVKRFSKREGKWKFQGRLRQQGTENKRYVGSGDMKAVAHKIAKAQGRELAQCKREKNKRRAPAETIRRFKVLAEMFKGWLPRDLTCAIQMRGRAAMAMVNAPGIYIGFLMGRERAWREALLTEWERADAETRLLFTGMDSNDAALQKQATRAMRAIFVGSFREWARTLDVEDREAWQKHVDRNVQNHLSLTAWGLRQGLLRKSSRANNSLKVANQEGEWYAVVPSEGPGDFAKMRRLHSLGRILLEAPVPTNNKEWLDCLTMVEMRASGMKLEATDYHFWWLVRAYMLVEMRHKGIQRLTVCQDWSRQHIGKAMVPDRSAWLDTWMVSVAGDSLRTLLRKLDFQEPVELLSCFACILGDSAIDQHSTDSLLARRSEIIKERNRVKRGGHHNEEGNPAVIVQTVMSMQQ